MYSRVICKLVLNDILMSFLHCKALRTAMYKRYINFIIIIIIIIIITRVCGWVAGVAVMILP